PVDDAVVAIEPTLKRIIMRAYFQRGEMPFPSHQRHVTAGFKRLGNRDAVRAQIACVARIWICSVIRGHHAHAGLMRIQSSQQRCARWAATRAVMKVSKTQPAASQRIKIWCVNLRSIAAYVGKSHIVCENENDIRPLAHRTWATLSE